MIYIIYLVFKMDKDKLHDWDNDNIQYDWVAYDADGQEMKFDENYKMTLTDYEKEREDEFWQCLREGKPFNFYEPKK